MKRSMRKMRTFNKNDRNIFESIMASELISVLKDFSKSNTDGVLIGGLALSYHSIPRMTQYIDVLFLSDNNIPKHILGFKHIRPHSFEHTKKHVKLETLSPEFLKIPTQTVEVVLKTSIIDNGIKIASAAGLVALKLFRLNARDKADIIALIKTGRIDDMSVFLLPEDKLIAYQQLVLEAETDPETPEEEYL